MRKPAAIGAALVLASLVPALTFSVLTPVLKGQFSVAQFGLVPVFLVFSVVAIMLIGTPRYFALRALRLVRWWSSLMAGCLGGAVVGLALRLPEAPAQKDFLILCPVGAAAAFVFWLVSSSFAEP
jgi:hypothetical protein